MWMYVEYVYFHFECSEHRLTRSFASLFGKCFILLFFTTASSSYRRHTYLYQSAHTFIHEIYIVHHTSHRRKHRQHKASRPPPPFASSSLPLQTPPATIIATVTAPMQKREDSDFVCVLGWGKTGA